LLCHILVDRCNESHRSYITVQDVREAVKELMEAGSVHMKFLWQTSDWEAKLALAAMAEQQKRLDYVTTAVIADRLGAYRISMGPGQIAKAMEQLASRDIVREVPGTTVTYDFTAQLYGGWLRRYKPLSKVTEMINYEPVTG
jgi:hypothetical protein